MFGNFLHDINLKTKKNDISPEAKEVELYVIIASSRPISE
jgi:hypothetical protein